MKRHVFLARSVQAPYAAVVEMVRDRPAELVDPASVIAIDSAHDLASQVGASVVGVEVLREVEMHFGAFEEVQGPLSVCTRSVSWHAADRPGWFPVLEAEIEAFPLSLTETQLTFVGHYEPPGGPVGGLVDAVALHGLADRTLRHFFAEVANRLATDATADSVQGSAGRSPSA